jgi:predicted Zn-dependent protease
MKLRLAAAVALLFLPGVPAFAQLGQLGGQLGKVNQAKEALAKANRAIQDLKFTDAEELQLGSDVSSKLRDRYGVVQDPAIHKYVTLVGMQAAQHSSLASLKWTFVVLDTDGVNAFAAPGGFVHITKGALALCENEAELAGVLAHEIGHVMARHTIRAIQKTKVEGALAKAATRSAFLEGVGNRLYAATLENAFDRGDENEADKVAMSLANDAGYSPAGLSRFLTGLAERNKALKERSGLFASHPETTSRINDITKNIRSLGFKNVALVQQRYASSVPYRGSNAFGLSGMSAIGGQRSSSSTIASAGSRGVNPDRDSRGGPIKSPVVVAVTAAEIAEFRKGIA